MRSTKALHLKITIKTSQTIRRHYLYDNTKLTTMHLKVLEKGKTNKTVHTLTIFVLTNNANVTTRTNVWQYKLLMKLN